MKYEKEFWIAVEKICPMGENPDSIPWLKRYWQACAEFMESKTCETCKHIKEHKMFEFNKPMKKYREAYEQCQHNNTNNDLNNDLNNDNLDVQKKKITPTPTPTNGRPIGQQSTKGIK